MVDLSCRRLFPRNSVLSSRNIHHWWHGLCFAIGRWLSYCEPKTRQRSLGLEREAWQSRESRFSWMRIPYSLAGNSRIRHMGWTAWRHLDEPKPQRFITCARFHLGSFLSSSIGSKPRNVPLAVHWYSDMCCTGNHSGAHLIASRRYLYGIWSPTLPCAHPEFIAS